MNTEETVRNILREIARNTADIQIGAVEIKDGDSDVRADIELDATKNALYVKSESLATSAKQDALLTELQKKADVTEDQPITLDGEEVDVSALSTLYNNTKTVPTGTAETIGSTQAIHSITIKALSTNTVAIYVGANGVTTSTGFELLAGESLSLDLDDVAKVYVISGSAAQVVRYIAI